MRFLALLFLFVCVPLHLNRALTPNRGKRLFVLISGTEHGTHIIAMIPLKRDVLGEWNCYNTTYDFVYAVVEPTEDGSKVQFTRYVMKDDYTPRTEKLELVFLYAKQARFSFFDIGSIVGFYWNSPKDFDPHRFSDSSRHLTKRWSEPLTIAQKYVD